MDDGEGGDEFRFSVHPSVRSGDAMAAAVGAVWAVALLRSAIDKVPNGAIILVIAVLDLKKD